MAYYAKNEYTGDGSTTQYAVSFTLGFLSRTHVICHVEDEVDGLLVPIPRTLTWITDGLVDIGATVPVGKKITIFRSTPKDSLIHDYSDGAGIIELNLDQSNLQNIMLNHEALDGIGTSYESSVEAAAYAAAALASKNAADADVVLTNADVILTHADVVATAALAANLPNAPAAGANKFIKTNATGDGWVYSLLLNTNAGADIASAATLDLSTATGNCPRITGTTATSAVTMNTGQWALVVADGAWPLTYNATTNKLNTGGTNYTLAAGDKVLYHKDLSGVVHGFIMRADGKSVVNPTSITGLTLNTATGIQNLTSAGAALLLDFATTTTATGRQQIGNPGTADVYRIRNAAATAIEIDSINYVYPGVDNTQNLGKAANRWKEVFAGTGTINTSDARQKTEIFALSPNELNASRQLANEIGWFQFLSSVAEKGTAARHHIGMTVQRAIEIMVANGLDPMAYGFICYDKWDDFVIEHEEKLDKDGNVIEEAWTEVVTLAGDSFGFRADQLALFIAAGINQRLSILEGV